MKLSGAKAECLEFRIENEVGGIAISDHTVRLGGCQLVNKVERYANI